jgi:hypothetical protein
VDATSGGWNKTGLALGAVSILEYAYRPVTLFAAPPIEPVKGHPAIPQPARAQQTFIAFGLGAAIHLIQTFLTDAGSVISWTWTGFPIKGPTLHPFAGIFIAVAATPNLFPLDSLHPALHLAGAAGAAVLYTMPNWLGFVGGVIFSTYLVAIFPGYIRAASYCSVPTTIGGALLFNVILDVLSVITVAYAFVPYGHLLRERTDIILSISVTAIIAGALAGRRTTLPTVNNHEKRSRVRLDLISRWTSFASLGLAIASVAYSYGKMPTTEPVPYYPEHRMFSGGIFTVHFGVDMAGRDSQRRIMELVRDMEVDVVCLW